MKKFKKGQKVVKLFSIAGIETASIVTIAKVSKGFVHCEGDDHLKYDAKNGGEHDPIILGAYSRLVPLES